MQHAFVTGLFQVKPVDFSPADLTFEESDDDLKTFKSAFLLFCQGNTVSINKN